MGSQGFGSSFFVAVVMKNFSPDRDEGQGFRLAGFWRQAQDHREHGAGNMEPEALGVSWESRRLII